MTNNLRLKPSIPDGVNLEAVLLNKNLRSRIPRDAIVPASLQRYQACVAAGEATLRLPFGECRLVVDLKAGNALLHLWRGKMPIAVAGVATSPLDADALWQFLLDLQTEQTGLHEASADPPEPEQPNSLPWLGVVFSPPLAASADIHMFRRISTLHWALGWAVVDYVAAQQRRN